MLRREYNENYMLSCLSSDIVKTLLILEFENMPCKLITMRFV